MTLSQNEAALTTNMAVGGAMSAAALATDGLVVAHPNGDKTASLALAAAVTSNGSGIKGFIPTAGAVAPGDMVSKAAVLAEAIGVDDRDFAPAADSAAFPSNQVAVKFARLHDQLLSMCSANAIGLRKPVRLATKK